MAVHDLECVVFGVELGDQYYDLEVPLGTKTLELVCEDDLEHVPIVDGKISFRAHFKVIPE